MERNFEISSNKKPINEKLQSFWDIAQKGPKNKAQKEKPVSVTSNCEFLPYFLNMQ